MNKNERRSYLFGELLACFENLDYKEVITSTDIRNYSINPKEMHGFLYRKVHDSRIGSGQPNMQYTEAGKEIARIYDEMTMEDARSNEPLDTIYLLAKHKMAIKLREGGKRL